MPDDNIPIAGLPVRLSNQGHHFINGDTQVSYKIKSEVEGRVCSVVGWSMAKYSNANIRSGGETRIRKYCLGIFKCVASDCTVVIRPQIPSSPKYSDIPVLGQYQSCSLHGKQFIRHIPCRAILTITKNLNKGYLTLKHAGFHEHAQPPETKLPSSVQMRLKQYVEAYPGLTPINFEAGVHPSVPSFGKMYTPMCNSGRFKHHTKKMKADQPSKESILEIRKWHQAQDKRYIVHATFDSGGAIVIQTDFMRETVPTNCHGFETDACESALRIYNLPNAVIQMTVGYNNILQQYMPYVVSLLYDKTAQSYHAHFEVFIDSLVSNIRSN